MDRLDAAIKLLQRIIRTDEAAPSVEAQVATAFSFIDAARLHHERTIVDYEAVDARLVAAHAKDQAAQLAGAPAAPHVRPSNLLASGKLPSAGRRDAPKALPCMSPDCMGEGRRTEDMPGLSFCGLHVDTPKSNRRELADLWRKSRSAGAR